MGRDLLNINHPRPETQNRKPLNPEQPTPGHPLAPTFRGLLLILRGREMSNDGFEALSPESASFV